MKHGNVRELQALAEEASAQGWGYAAIKSAARARQQYNTRRALIKAKGKPQPRRIAHNKERAAFYARCLMAHGETP
jgi:transcriptional regulator with AAA-type ATPase domain